MRIQGRVWKFGDNLKAGGQIISTKYDTAYMEKKLEEVAQHVLEDVDPEFARKVQKGDILVAGKAFGWGHGHYHMQAVQALKACGVSCVIAESYGGTFQRKAINMGFPALEIREVPGMVETRDVLDLDLSGGKATNVTRGTSASFRPVPPMIIQILETGGLEQYTLQKLGKL